MVGEKKLQSARKSMVTREDSKIGGVKANCGELGLEGA